MIAFEIWHLDYLLIKGKALLDRFEFSISMFKW